MQKNGGIRFGGIVGAIRQRMDKYKKSFLFSYDGFSPTHLIVKRGMNGAAEGAHNDF